MTSWRWVGKDVLYAIHDRQMAEHGGLSGVLDAGRLEAALDRPQNLAAYGSLDAATLAAAYATGWPEIMALPMATNAPAGSLPGCFWPTMGIPYASIRRMPC